MSPKCLIFGSFRLTILKGPNQDLFTKTPRKNMTVTQIGISGLELTYSKRFCVPNRSIDNSSRDFSFFNLNDFTYANVQNLHFSRDEMSLPFFA